MRFHIYNGNHKAYTSPSSIIDNLWHHVAWTIASSATNACSVYIDGVYHNTQAQHDIGDITTRNLFIGSLFTTAGDSDYRPTMQAYDFMIFQSELTQHQIISLYSRPTYTLLRVDGLQGLTFRILLQCSSNAAQYYNLVDVNTNSLTLSSPSYCSQQPTSQYSSCYCPMGMFNTGPNQCLPCPAGTYGTAPSITACASCPDGTYTPYQQQTTCLACLS